jgi:hypothetical protein
MDSILVTQNLTSIKPQKIKQGLTVLHALASIYHSRKRRDFARLRNFAATLQSLPFLLVISPQTTQKNPQSELLYSKDGFELELLSAGAELIALEFEIEATACQAEFAGGARDVAAMLAQGI